MPDIKRGRMTGEEKVEIERLALTLKKPTPSAVARRLNRHVATVTWYMLTRNLIERAPGPSPKRPYTKKDGTKVYPFSPEEDDRLLELRAQGKCYREIGELLTAEFGIPRNGHKTQVRNVILTARPDDGR